MTHFTQKGLFDGIDFRYSPMMASSRCALGSEVGLRDSCRDRPASLWTWTVTSSWPIMTIDGSASSPLTASLRWALIACKLLKMQYTKFEVYSYMTLSLLKNTFSEIKDKPAWTIYLIAFVSHVKHLSFPAKILFVFLPRRIRSAPAGSWVQRVWLWIRMDTLSLWTTKPAVSSSFNPMGSWWLSLEAGGRLTDSLQVRRRL